MHIGRKFLWLTLFLLSPAVENAQTPRPRSIPKGVSVVRDLTYARYGQRELKLDLYRPIQSGNTMPVIVVVRGGGWQQGDKEGFGPIAGALAARGFAAACIEYRTSAEAPFPAAVQDTKAAVRWLRANAAAQRLNPDSIGAIGGSAGGHLVLYLAMTSALKELEGDGGNSKESSRLQAVVGMAALSDLLAFSPTDASLTKFLGVASDKDRQKWVFASPATHVDQQSPPALLLHSEHDRTVDVRHALRLAERYAESGVHIEVSLFPKAPHAFWNFDEWFDESMTRAALFFGRHLKP